MVMTSSSAVRLDGEPTFVVTMTKGNDVRTLTEVSRATAKAIKARAPKGSTVTMTAVEDVREADDDHFYGPWKGGSKASGGHPDRLGQATHRVEAARGTSQWDPQDPASFTNFITKVYEDTGVKPGTGPNSGDVIPYSLWAGKPYEARSTVAIYRGPEGKPAGYVIYAPKYGKHNRPSIVSVSVAVDSRGKGIGTKMYDWAQDHGGIPMYKALGGADDMTVAGKAFALSWLRHRQEVEIG